MLSQLLRTRASHRLIAAVASVLIGFCLAAPTAWAQAMPRAALIIGNGEYQFDPLQVLDNPLNDARAVNSVLQELGFEVIYVEDGDIAGLRTAVEQIPEFFPEDGIGLFYYAGHGVQYKGVNYLLPTDFRLTTAEDMPQSSLALNEVLQAMQRAGVKVGIVILDACRENPFGAQSDAFGQGLALVDAPGETLIAYATRPGGLAEDGIGANSPYTAALISALEFPNQSVHEVFAAVRAKVSQATDGRQIPWILGSLGPLGTKFRFREIETLVAEALPLPDQPITLASVQWKTIQQSVDPTDFERFLMLHSETPYATLAQRQLQSLNSQGREPLPQMEVLPADRRPVVPDGIDTLITECDVMAADPFDSGRLTAGVPWGLVNTRIAIRACVRSLAEQPDSPRLLFTLGRALDIAERFDEAEQFYEQAAQRGYAAGFRNLGYMHRTGRGRADDYAEAAQYYRTSALLGSPAGRTAIATLYREGLGVPQSDEEAFKWYRLAAADGWPGALDALGNFYRLGRGVAADPVESVRYYRMSAMLGHSNAMYNLARAYLKGDGVKQDYREAVTWFVNAMEEGNSYAPYYLGRMFRDGWGVERSYPLALTYLKLSADRGFPEAYARLAEMHENGEGTEPNLEEAYYLFWIAREGGRAHGNQNSLAMAADANQRLQDLRAQLGDAVASRVQARAEEWLEQNGLLQFRLLNTW